MPNGMNLHVWGPVSVRHNDLYTLVNFEIEGKLENLQINIPFQYKMFGDPSRFSIFSDGWRPRNVLSKRMHRVGLSTPKNSVEVYGL